MAQYTDVAARAARLGVAFTLSDEVLFASIAHQLKVAGSVATNKCDARRSLVQRGLRMLHKIVIVGDADVNEIGAAHEHEDIVEKGPSD